MTGPGVTVMASAIKPVGLPLPMLRTPRLQTNPGAVDERRPIKLNMLTPVINRPGQAKRSQTKLPLLPITRASADDMSLRYHVSLEALRVGHGYVGAAQALATAMVVAFFLADAGYGTMSREAFSIREDILARGIKTGGSADEWYFDDRGYQIFSALLKLHDRQLRKAPFSALLRANDRLKSFVKSKARRNNACLQAMSSGATKGEK